MNYVQLSRYYKGILNKNELSNMLIPLCTSAKGIKLNRGLTIVSTS